MATKEVSTFESGLSDTNLCVLVGELSSDPRPLELASGSVLLRCEVTVRAGGGYRLGAGCPFRPDSQREVALGGGEGGHGRQGASALLSGRRYHREPYRGGG